MPIELKTNRVHGELEYDEVDDNWDAIKIAVNGLEQTVGNQVLDNLSATTDPTENDDADDGYIVGTRWLNTVSGAFFICRDTTVGAAVWEAFAGDFSAQLAAINSRLDDVELLTWMGI